MEAENRDSIDLGMVYRYMARGFLTYENYNNIRDHVKEGQDLVEVLSQFQDPGSDTTLFNEMMTYFED